MKKKKEKKYRSVAVFLCVCAVLFAFAAAGFALLLYALSPLDGEQDAVSARVEIPSGMSVRALGARLAREKLVRSETAFYLAARCPFLTGRTHAFVLKSGVYDISSARSVAQLLDMFEDGKGTYITTVIPEGLTAGQIAAVLEDKGVCSADDFKAAVTDARLLQEYGIPVGVYNTKDSFEGYLFPDTYFFAPQMSGEEVVRVMADTFFQRFQSVVVSDRYKADGTLAPDRLHDIVTLASIVEREYRVTSEAPLIASVFTNRIDARSGLYSCATIAYIITEILGRPHPDVITYADLKIDSPYNTYKWAGLPPGPISNPGMTALQAAANPPRTDYFYFTLTDADAGMHTFTETLSSHASAGANFKTKKAAAAK